MMTWRLELMYQKGFVKDGRTSQISVEENEGGEFLLMGRCPGERVAHWC